MTATRLTEHQVAAVAKLACGYDPSGGLALLCGPRGSGKTTVLRELVSAVADRSVALRPAAGWATADALPDLVLADDAHEEDAAALARLLRRCRQRQPAASLILAGEGRVFTLVARDALLEQAVRLRVAIPAFSSAESRRLFETAVAATAGSPVAVADEAARTAHEIAGGSPAALLRLAELAGIVAAARPDHALAVADIEAIHERLSPAAA